MTIRSIGGRVAAYAWLVFAGLNLLDLFVGITGDPVLSPTSVTVALLLLLGSGIAYAVGLRPAIVADDEALTIRNPLRDVRAPWGAVREIIGDNVVRVRFTGPDGTELEARAWVHQTSPRAQGRAEARARKQARTGPGLDLRGRTPTRFAAQQLTEMHERHRPKTRSGAPGKAAAAKTEKPARGTIGWSVPAVAALAVPLAGLVAAGIVAAVS